MLHKTLEHYLSEVIESSPEDQGVDDFQELRLALRFNDFTTIEGYLHVHFALSSRVKQWLRAMGFATQEVLMLWRDCAHYISKDVHTRIWEFV